MSMARKKAKPRRRKASAQAESRVKVQRPALVRDNAVDSAGSFLAADASVAVIVNARVLQNGALT